MTRLKPLHIMARNLGRLARFGGNTGSYWWSVLHHSFLVEAIVSDTLDEASMAVRDIARMYALIHDLHEADTGDIITPMKSVDVCEYQEERDVAICAALAIPLPHKHVRTIVRRADERAMRAEAHVLNDPYCWLDESMATPLTPKQNRKLYGIESPWRLERRDREHVKLLLDVYGSYHMTSTPYSRGVTDYIREVTKGVLACKRLRVEWRGPTPYWLLQSTKLPTVPPYLPNPTPLFETEEEARAAGPDAWLSYEEAER